MKWNEISFNNFDVIKNDYHYLLNLNIFLGFIKLLLSTKNNLKKRNPWRIFSLLEMSMGSRDIFFYCIGLSVAFYISPYVFFSLNTICLKVSLPRDETKFLPLNSLSVSFSYKEKWIFRNHLYHLLSSSWSISDNLIVEKIKTVLSLFTYDKNKNLTFGFKEIVWIYLCWSNLCFF